MSDESGGDFGGGSVSWVIRYEGDVPENGQDVEKHARKNSKGSDKRDLKIFFLVLKNMPGLETELEEAVKLLRADPSLAQVVIELPIEKGILNQIRVLWEPPHDLKPPYKVRNEKLFDASALGKAAGATSSQTSN